MNNWNRSSARICLVHSRIMSQGWNLAGRNRRRASCWKSEKQKPMGEPLIFLGLFLPRGREPRTDWSDTSNAPCHDPTELNGRMSACAIGFQFNGSWAVAAAAALQSDGQSIHKSSYFTTLHRSRFLKTHFSKLIHVVHYRSSLTSSPLDLARPGPHPRTHE